MHACIAGHQGPRMSCYCHILLSPHQGVRPGVQRTAVPGGCCCCCQDAAGIKPRNALTRRWFTSRACHPSLAPPHSTAAHCNRKQLNPLKTMHAARARYEHKRNAHPKRCQSSRTLLALLCNQVKLGRTSTSTKAVLSNDNRLSRQPQKLILEGNLQSASNQHNTRTREPPLRTKP